MGNVYLIGMMGSGKSTVGKILAEKIGYSFFDTDEFIVSSTGKSIANVLSEDGDDALALHEFTALSSAPINECIISTGGRTYLDKKCREFIDNTGKVVFLDTGVKDIADRLNTEEMKKRNFNIDSRDELINFLNKLRRERLAAYKSRSMIIEGSGTPNEVCKRIVRGFKNEKIRAALREGVELTGFQEDTSEEDV